MMISSPALLFRIKNALAVRQLVKLAAKGEPLRLILSGMNGNLERFAFTPNHFSWRFCSVFGAKKLENIQIYPAFLHLKPNQNSSADSDPE
ncbi:MAG: hypothetical protein GY927_06730 [bacterium]|nr:hypothetical protein [bacterium]